MRNYGSDLLSLAQGVQHPEARPQHAPEELESENERLKLLVAELILEKQLLQEIARGRT